MSRWVRKAGDSSFSLMVSLPRNDPEMAIAAAFSGADAVKVHMNCKHPASGFVFGSFKRERKNLEAVAKSISIPVGIVPGDEEPASGEELKQLQGIGFDFFDIFAHRMPLEYLKAPLGKMVCIDGRYTPADAKQLASLGVEVFEASIIPHEEYGEPVVLSDLARWKLLTEKLTVPLLVSTQRDIKPEECALLQKAGVRGIVIGIVVTGDSAKEVEETTSLFRKAIDAL